MIDKRVLDYTNLTDKDAFYLWMNECPVKEEFTDAFEDENDRCELYFFRIPNLRLNKHEDAYFLIHITYIKKLLLIEKNQEI